MSLVKIINSQEIILKDGSKAYKISNTGKHSGILALEPNKNYWFSQTNENIASEINGLFEGEQGDEYAWELYGSDHNTINVFYGSKEDIEKIENILEEKVYTVIKSLKADDFNNDLIMYSKWDFSDDTSLIILHLENQLYNYPLEDLNLKKSNLITIVAGAEVDDIMLEEIVGAQAAKLLTKFKIVNTDSEDLEEFIENGIEYANENIKFNNSKIGNKDKELFLQMANHLFNDIVSFTDVTEENSPNKIIAEKLKKYMITNKLVAPVDNEITELQMVNENSNKFYKIEFKVNNNEYIVNVYYGKIGSEPIIMEKIKTSILEDAQKEYLSIVKNQFAKGYEFNRRNKSLKIS